MFGASPNPSGESYPAAGSFATLPGLDRLPPRPAPQLGQHSEEVLAERLGLSGGAIAALIDRKIVAQA
jgi:2-methylfumaryl-CoA isomerase